MELPQSANAGKRKRPSDISRYSAIASAESLMRRGEFSCVRFIEIPLLRYFPGLKRRFLLCERKKEPSNRSSQSPRCAVKRQNRNSQKSPSTSLVVTDASASFIAATERFSFAREEMLKIGLASGQQLCISRKFPDRKRPAVHTTP